MSISSSCGQFVLAGLFEVVEGTTQSTRQCVGGHSGKIITRKEPAHDGYG
jgi:hypothetical protein